MADQDIIKLAQEWLDAQSAGDYNRMGTTLADDVIYNELGTQRRIQGRQALVNLQQEWRRAFPDVKGNIQNIFVSGNQALAEITWDGTFRGDMVTPGGTIPANGRRMEQLSTAFVYAVEGGKIKEIRHYFDVMSLLQQIGAMP
jgi:steroid delta-isomerase-like uncharacterized protein